jgi:hypothetical protein
LLEAEDVQNVVAESLFVTALDVDEVVDGEERTLLCTRPSLSRAGSGKDMLALSSMQLTRQHV